MEDTQNKIDHVNSLFSNMIDKYKINYVNYHKNSTLSMPTTTPTNTKIENVVSSSNSNEKDPNEELLSNYRYAANNLLEHVRSQMASNSRTISKINSDIVPIQTQYLSILELGNNFDSTKSAATASLDDYNELYKVTFFSILTYLVGSASILYLMFKPKLQSV
uniref:Uncharacterized protein n=1 Tax=viral metagenome TaxID=1070528 RepID=A0A6C0F2B8_9ZZZZ